MPRYFFNLDDHLREIDREGTMLSGPEEARVQAVMFAADYLSDNPRLVWDGRPFRVDVQDEAGTTLLNVVITASDPAKNRAAK